MNLFLFLPITDSPNKTQSEKDKSHQNGMFVIWVSALWADEKMWRFRGFLCYISGHFKETEQR